MRAKNQSFVPTETIKSRTRNKGPARGRGGEKSDPLGRGVPLETPLGWAKRTGRQTNGDEQNLRDNEKRGGAD